VTPADWALEALLIITLAFLAQTLFPPFSWSIGVVIALVL